MGDFQMGSTSRFFGAIVSVCLLFTSSAMAQSSSGTITGRVLDSSGQSVPAATVTLTKQDTREVRTLSTPESGDFVFTALQPGPYSLQVEAAGFKQLEKTN